MSSAPGLSSLSVERQEKACDSGVERFSRRLSFVQLPIKATALLMKCVGDLPLKSEYLKKLAKQCKVVKAINSTFVLPAFCLKQVRLFNAIGDLKQKYSSHCQPSQLFWDVKKVFCLAMGTLSAGLKVSLMLDQTGVINLKQISHKFPSLLRKRIVILSCVETSIQFVENSYRLGQFLKSEHHSNQNLSLKELLHSRKGSKLVSKLAKNTVKISFVFLEVASKFYGLGLPLQLDTCVMRAKSIYFLISKIRSFYR